MRRTDYPAIIRMRKEGFMQCSPAALTVPDCMTKPAFLGPQLRQQVRSISSSHPKAGNGFLLRVADMFLANGAILKADGGRACGGGNGTGNLCFQGIRDQAERSFYTSRKYLQEYQPRPHQIEALNNSNKAAR
jgi:hypothetical protein